MAVGGLDLSHVADAAMGSRGDSLWVIVAVKFYNLKIIGGAYGRPCSHVNECADAHAHVIQPTFAKGIARESF